MSIPQALTLPASDIYSRAAEVLAEMLPPEVLAECDRILGETPESKERWSLYQTTHSHLINTQAAQQ